MSKLFRVMKGEPVVLSLLRYPLYVTPKVNGIRGYVSNSRVLSTANKLLPNKALQAEFSVLPPVDGEFVAGDVTDTQNSLDLTSSIIRAHDKPVDNVTFYVFDHLGSLDSAYKDRVKELDRLRHPKVIILENEIVYNEDQLLKTEEEYVRLGYEGLITRDPEAIYKFGKSTAKQAWMGKMKRFADAEGIVIGYTERMHNANEAFTNELGRTARSSCKAGKVGMGTLGSLILRLPNGSTVSVGTGFDDALRAFLWKIRDDLLGRLVKYKFFELGSGDVPVLPVFLCFRDSFDI